MQTFMQHTYNLIQNRPSYILLKIIIIITIMRYLKKSLKLHSEEAYLGPCRTFIYQTLARIDNRF